MAQSTQTGLSTRPRSSSVDLTSASLHPLYSPTATTVPPKNNEVLLRCLPRSASLDSMVSPSSPFPTMREGFSRVPSSSPSPTASEPPSTTASPRGSCPAPPERQGPGPCVLRPVGGKDSGPSAPLSPLHRLAREGHPEARLLVLGRELQAFLREWCPCSGGAVVEAAFVECLRRCGWTVVRHQLCPPTAAFQSFGSHTFWKACPPSCTAGAAACSFPSPSASCSSLCSCVSLPHGEGGLCAAGPSSEIGLVVDFHFRELFAVARPLPAFQALLEALPEPFVGTELRLRAAIATLCRLASHSLQSQQLAVPPWRRARFLQACYRRGLGVGGGFPSDDIVAFPEKDYVDLAVTTFLTRRHVALRWLRLSPCPTTLAAPFPSGLLRRTSCKEGEADEFEKLFVPRSPSPRRSSLAQEEPEPLSMISAMLRKSAGGWGRVGDRTVPGRVR
eukprot:RCo007649